MTSEFSRPLPTGDSAAMTSRQHPEQPHHPGQRPLTTATAKDASAGDTAASQSLLQDLLADSRQLLYGGQLFDAVRFSTASLDMHTDSAHGIRRVRLPRDRRALLAYVRQFQARHGRKAGQFGTAMLLLPLAGCSSLGFVSDGTDLPPPDPDPEQGLEGLVIDGYLAGAEVAREDGSGEVVVTDDSGRFEGLLGEGPVVASGGIDVATGLPFTGELTAPDGAGVVTPLTTLIEARLSEGLEEDAASAAAAVAAEYGLSDAVGESSLLDLDPIDTDNQPVYASGAQVANALSLATAAGGNASALAASLAQQSSLLQDAGALSDALQATGIDTAAADDLATAIVNAATAIDGADDREGVARIQYLVQGEWVDAVSAGDLLEALATPEAIAAAAAEAPISGDTGAGTDGPTVSIEFDADALAAGDTTTVTIVFSEPPVELDADALASLLAVTGGELQDLTVDPEDPTRFHGDFLPEEDAAGRAEILLPGGSYQNEDGLPGQGARASIPFDTEVPALSLDPVADPDLVEQSGFALTGSAAPESSLDVRLSDADGTELSATVTADADGAWSTEELELLTLARGPVAVTLSPEEAGESVEVEAAFELRPYAETPVTTELGDAALATLLDHVEADALVVDASGMDEAELLNLIEARDRVAQFRELEFDIGSAEFLLETLQPEGRLDFATARIDATDMDGAFLDLIAAAFIDAEATPVAVSGQLELSAQRPEATFDLLLDALDADAQVRVNVSDMALAQLDGLVDLIASGADVTLDGLLQVQAGLASEDLATLLDNLDSAEVALQPQDLPLTALAELADALAGEDPPERYQLQGPLELSSELDGSQLMTLLTRLNVELAEASAEDASIEVDVSGMSAGQLGVVAAFLPELQGQLPATLSGELQLDANLTELELFSLLLLADADSTDIHVDAAGMSSGQLGQVLAAADDLASLDNLVLDGDNATASEMATLLAADVAASAEIVADPSDMSPSQLTALADNLDGLHALQGSLNLTAALSAETLTTWLDSDLIDAIEVTVDSATMDGTQRDAVTAGIEHIDTLTIGAGQEFVVDAGDLSGTSVGGSGTLALTGTASADLLAEPGLSPRTLELSAADLAADVSGLELNETSTFVVTPAQTQQLKADGIQGTDTADTLIVDVSGEDFSAGNIPQVAVHADLGAGDDEIAFRFGPGDDDRSVALSADSVLDFGSGQNRLIASEGTVDISAATVSSDPGSGLDIQVNSGLTLTADQFQTLLDALSEDAAASLSGAGRIEVTGNPSEGSIDLGVFGDAFTAGGLTPPTIDFVDLDGSAIDGDSPDVILPEADSDVRILLGGEAVAGFDGSEIEATAVTVFTRSQLAQVLDAIADGAGIDDVTVASTVAIDADLDLSAATALNVESTATNEAFAVSEGAELTLTPAQAANLTTTGSGLTRIAVQEGGELPADVSARLETSEVELSLAADSELDVRDVELDAFSGITLDAGTLQLDSEQLDGLEVSGSGDARLLVSAAEGWLDGDLSGLAVPRLEFALSGDLALLTELADDVDTLAFDNPDAEDRIVELGTIDGGLPSLEVAEAVTAWLDGDQADGLDASGDGRLAIGSLQGDVNLDLDGLDTAEVYLDVSAAAVDRLDGHLGQAVVVLSGQGDVRLGADLHWEEAEFVQAQDNGSPRLLFSAELSAAQLDDLLGSDRIDAGLARVVDAEGMAADQLATVLDHSDELDAIENLSLDAGVDSADLEAWLSHPALDLASLNLDLTALDTAQREAVDAGLGGRLTAAEDAGELAAALQMLAQQAPSDAPLTTLFEQPTAVLGAVLEDLFATAQANGLSAVGLLSADADLADPALGGLIELQQAIAHALDAVNGTTEDTVVNPKALEVADLQAIEAAYAALPDDVTLTETRDSALADLAALVAPLNAGDVPASQLENLEQLLATASLQLSEDSGGLGTTDLIQFLRPPSLTGSRLYVDNNVAVEPGDVSYGLLRDDGSIYTVGDLNSPNSDFTVIEDPRFTDLPTAELSGFVETAYFDGSFPDHGVLMLTRDGELISLGDADINTPPDLMSDMRLGVSQVIAMTTQGSPDSRQVAVLMEDGQVHAWWPDDLFFSDDALASIELQLQRMDDIDELLGPKETGFQGVLGLREDGSVVHWSTAMEREADQIMADAPAGADVVSAGLASPTFLATSTRHPNYFVHREDGSVESVLPTTSLHYRGPWEIRRLDADDEPFDQTLPGRILPGNNMHDEGTFDHRIPAREVGDPANDPFGWTFSAATIGAAGGDDAFWENFFSHNVFAAGNPVRVGPGYFPRATDPREFPGDLRTHPTLEDTEFLVSNPNLEAGIVKLVGNQTLAMALTEDGEVLPIGRLDSSSADYVFDQLGLDSGVVDIIAVAGQATSLQRNDFAALKEDGELILFNAQTRLPSADAETAAALSEGHVAFLPQQFEAYVNNSRDSAQVLNTLDEEGGVHGFFIPGQSRQDTPPIERVDTSDLNAALAARGPYQEITEVYTNVGVALHESGEVTVWNLWTGELIEDAGRALSVGRFETYYGAPYADVLAGDDFVALEGRMLLREDGSVLPLPRVARPTSEPSLFGFRPEEIEQFAVARDDQIEDLAALVSPLTEGSADEVLEGLNQADFEQALRPFLDVALLTMGTGSELSDLAELDANLPSAQADAALNVLAGELLAQRPEAGFADVDEALATITPLLGEMAAFSSFGSDAVAAINAAIAGDDAGQLLSVLDQNLRDELELNEAVLDAYLGTPPSVLGERIDAFDAARDLGDFLDDWDAFLAQDGVAGSTDAGLFLAQRLLDEAPSGDLDSLIDLFDLANAEFDALQPLIDAGLEQQALLQGATDFFTIDVLLQPGTALRDLLDSGSDRLAAHEAFEDAGREGLPGLQEASAQARIIGRAEDFSTAPGLADEPFTALEFLAFALHESANGYDSLVDLDTAAASTIEAVLPVAATGADAVDDLQGLGSAADLASLFDATSAQRGALEDGAAVLAAHANYVAAVGFSLISLQAAADWADLIDAVDSYLEQDGVGGSALDFLAQLTWDGVPSAGWEDFAGLRDEAEPLATRVAELAGIGQDARDDLEAMTTPAELLALLAADADSRDLLADGTDLFSEHEAFAADPGQDALPGIEAAAGYAEALAVADDRWQLDGLQTDAGQAFMASATMDEAPDSGFADFAALASAMEGVADALEPISNGQSALPAALADAESASDVILALNSAAGILATAEDTLAAYETFVSEGGDAILLLADALAFAAAMDNLEALRAEAGDSEVDGLIGQLLLATAADAIEDVDGIRSELQAAVDLGQATVQAMAAVNDEDGSALPAAFDDLATALAAVPAAGIDPAAVTAAVDTFAELDPGAQAEALDTLAGLSPGTDWVLTDLLQADFIDRAQSAFEDPDTVFVSETFEVDDFLGATTPVTVDDLLEQPDWQLLEAEATRDQTVAMILVSETPPAEDLQAVLRVADLDAGTVLAGRELATIPVADGSDELQPAQRLLPSLDASSDFYLAAFASDGGNPTLTLSTYSAAAEVSGTLEPIAEDRELEFLPDIAPGSIDELHGWFPAAEADGPDYLVANSAFTPGEWPRIYLGVDDSELGNVTLLPISGHQLPNNAFVTVAEVFRSGDELWLDLAIFDELIGEFDLKVRMSQAPEGGGLLAEEVTTEQYQAERSEALELDSLLQIGTATIDLRPKLVDQDFSLEQDWAVQVLATGEILVRAEIADADSALPDHERWLLFDEDGELLGDREFNSGAGALMRSLQGGDDGVYFQQLQGGSANGSFQQEDTITVHRLDAADLLDTLGADSDSPAEADAAATLASYSLEELSADEVSGSDSPADELLRIAAFVEASSAATAVAQSDDLATATPLASYLTRSDGDGVQASQRLPGQLEGFHFDTDLDAAASYLLLDAGEVSFTLRHETASGAFEPLPAALFDVLQAEDPLLAGLEVDDLAGTDAIPGDVLAWSVREVAFDATPAGPRPIDGPAPAQTAPAPQGDRVLVMDLLFEDGRPGSAVVALTPGSEPEDPPQLAAIEVSEDIMLTGAQVDSGPDTLTVTVSGLDDSDNGLEQHLYEVVIDDAGAAIDVTPGSSVDLGPEGLDALGLSEFGRIETGLGLQPTGEPGQPLLLRTLDPEASQPKAWQGVMLSADADGTLVPIDGRNTLDLRSAAPLQESGFAAFPRQVDLTTDDPFPVVFAALSGSLLEAETTAAELLDGIPVAAEEAEVHLLDYVERSTTDGDSASFVFAVQAASDATGPTPTTYVVRLEADATASSPTLTQEGSVALAGRFAEDFDFTPDGLPLVPRELDGKLYLALDDAGGSTQHYVVDADFDLAATGLDARGEFLLAQSDYFGLPLDPEAFIREQGLDFSELPGSDLEVLLGLGDFTYTTPEGMFVQELFDPESVQTVIGSPADDVLRAGFDAVTLRGGAGNDRYELEGIGVDPDNSFEVLFEATAAANGSDNQVLGFAVGDPDDGGDVLGFAGLDAIDLRGETLAQLDAFDAAALGSDVGLLAFTETQEVDVLDDIQAWLDDGEVVYVLAEFEQQANEVSVLTLEGGEDEGRPLAPEPLGTLAGLGADSLGDPVLDENLRDFSV